MSHENYGGYGRRRGISRLGLGSLFTPWKRRLGMQQNRTEHGRMVVVLGSAQVPVNVLNSQDGDRGVIAEVGPVSLLFKLHATTTNSSVS